MPRRPRIEVATGFFAELVPPPSDDDLRAVTYKQGLEWAADRNGILRRDRLKRLQRARRYHPKWIERLVGRRLDSVLDDANEWRERQRID
jgi:hypothetical protein